MLLTLKFGANANIALNLPQPSTLNLLLLHDEYRYYFSSSSLNKSSTLNTLHSSFEINQTMVVSGLASSIRAATESATFDLAGHDVSFQCLSINLSFVS
jgi:hypothetical protein